jgi:DNA-binding NtrC family response regulator
MQHGECTVDPQVGPGDNFPLARMENLSQTEPLPRDQTALPKLKLVVVLGPDLGRELVLESGTLVIGKSRDCDFILSDKAVSGRHLAIEVQRGLLVLADLSSTNGSFCNEVSFTRAEARPGATVRIGRTTFKVLPVSERAEVTALPDRERFGGLLGGSKAMRALYAVMERAAAAPPAIQVLITGESGTGKELCARALHAASPRTKAPFVVVDLGACQSGLLESDLFGHQVGAFTGATKDRAGAFAEAQGGTLFLDEVGELPLELQSRLLRAIERREVKPVGGDRYRATDVRVLCSTHSDLAAEVKAGRFRADLYHRLAAVVLTLPPLRERGEDVPVLVRQFLTDFGAKADSIQSETLSLLQNADWPGNVRELRNVIERLCVLGDAGVTAELEAAGKRPLPADAALVEANPGDFYAAKQRLLDTFELDYLRRLLAHSGGNVKRAAERSGINRIHLYRLLKKHELMGRGGEVE